MMDSSQRPSLEDLAKTAEPLRGIVCPHCKASAQWSVYYTRPYFGFILRVRTCRKCGQNTVTKERAV